MPIALALAQIDSRSSGIDWTRVATVKLQLEVPVELAGAVLAAVGDVLAPTTSEESAAGPSGKWDKALAHEAIDSGAAPLERRLLRRLAEARGQRISISELARDFGLPDAPSAEHDFPRLTGFCADKPAERPFPIKTVGSGDAAAYWMSVADAAAFAFAFAPMTDAPLSAGHEQSGATDKSK